MVKLGELSMEQLKLELRERNVIATGGKRNKKEKLHRRLWEQLEKDEEDPCVFQLYGDSYEVCPTGSIVEDTCATDKRQEARTYVEAIARWMQQSYATIQEIAEQDQREQEKRQWEEKKKIYSRGKMQQKKGEDDETRAANTVRIRIKN